MTTKALALVPARAGSKGLPRKNVRPCAGRPLVAWTIEAALATPGLEVFVSTDDEEVVRIAEACGAKVEYRRPAPLASDEAGMVEVALDALAWREAKGPLPPSLLLLQPTSPLRTRADLDAALALLDAHEAVVGVSPMWTHPTECVEVQGDAWRFLVPPDGAVRRQDYAHAYQFINGAIYGVRVARFQREKSFLPSDAKLLVMSDENTIDIDTERDFLLAERLLERRATG